MSLALEEAQKARDQNEVPVGAIITREGLVIARAHNMKEGTQNPTGHAEILALQRASEHLKSWRLLNCCLYVTLEPCVMCAGALIQARVQRVVYATPDPKGGAMESLFSIGSDPRLNHQIQTHRGPMEAQATHMLHQFFKERRQRVNQESTDSIVVK